MDSDDQPLLALRPYMLDNRERKFLYVMTEKEETLRRLNADRNVGDVGFRTKKLDRGLRGGRKE